MSTTAVDPSAAVTERPAAAPARRTRRRGRPGAGAAAASHAVLIVASFVAFFPVAWLVFLSLGPDKDDYLHPGEIWHKMTLDNYAFVLQHTGFWDWLRTTLVVTLGTTLIGVVIAASSGYAVSRMRFPGYKKFMWALLVTQMFPVAILMVPMYQILSELRLIDTYLGLILVYCTTVVPYSAWLLKGYFDTIPFEIDEAGRVDGLSPFGTFLRLVLPLAKPGLAVAAFYNFLTAFGEVAFASTFMLSEDKYTFAVGLQSFISEHDAQRNLMAATAVLIAVPASAFFYLVQKNLVTGLTAGGTKG
ncbi:sugar ABC transporter permease [Streptomyces echinoruber]|uniref:ABC transporter permease n=1 Tax=Streptomyces echinoruber TaxID=68898 RepID=A0A918QSW4_9ACTN|nr:ABC transporter permease subunit [Streptomyces echinoruber]GGZ70463.1 ABC transporter permease [Streptomyces echinoruber]